MSRSGDLSRRCHRCRMHRDLCLCAMLPTLRTETRVVIVMHTFEDHEPTNSGRLAALCLERGSVVIHGRAGDPPPDLAFDAGTEPVVLFPYRDARPLGEFASRGRPLTLVVPDGSFRQAAKLPKRVPCLRALPRAILPPGPPSQYRLRTAAHPGSVSTLEAVARALGLLEGTPVQLELERIFRAMVQRTLWARGKLAASEVESGIPAGASRTATPAG